MTRPQLTALSVAYRCAGVADFAATRAVVVDAFGDEGAATAEYLDALRAEGCILGEWLAEDPTGPIAHVVFSRVWMEDGTGSRQPAAMLTPLAVRVDRQRIRIGTQLVEHALRALEAQGETVFFVLGHPDFYPRVGFLAAHVADINGPWRGDSAFMARARAPINGRLVMPMVIADAH